MNKHNIEPIKICSGNSFIGWKC